MSFTRINPSGYSVGAKVTSASFNQLDYDHSVSLDRSAAGDNAGTGGGIAGEIEWLSGSALVVDAGSLVSISSSVEIFGDLDVANGALVLLNSGAELEASSGSTVQFDAGSTFTMNGAETMSGTQSITGAVTVNTSGSIVTAGTGTITSGVAGSIILGGGSNDWPSLGTPRVRPYSFFAAQCCAINPNTSLTAVIPLSDSAQALQFFIIPWLPNGATMISMSFIFQTANGWTAVPTTFPSATFFSEDVSTAGDTTLGSGSYPSEILSVWNNTALKHLNISIGGTVDTSANCYYGSFQAARAANSDDAAQNFALRYIEIGYTLASLQI